MKKFILDSWAILSFLHKEKSHKKIKEFLAFASKGKVHLFVSIVNLVEVYYKLIRKVGRDEAIKTVCSLQKIPIETVSATDDLVFKMAEVKADYPIALADCFAIAVALDKKAPILTGDPEFKKVEELIKIEWL